MTPGTNLVWRTIAEWCACARILEQRRCASSTYSAMDAHWQVFPEHLVRKANRTECADLIEMLAGRPTRTPWEKALRGHRSEKWSRINVEARNRLCRLIRAEDHDAMGLGHNSRNAA